LKLIQETTSIIEKTEKTRPKGWLGPWISESHVTLDLLQEEKYLNASRILISGLLSRYKYVLDWACDDQPFWMKTRNGNILSIPYPQELNDIPALVRRVSAKDFGDMIIDQFDEMINQVTYFSLSPLTLIV
jgi:hypothetical protein